MKLYENPWPHEVHRVIDILRWKLRLGPQETPELPDAPQTPAAWRAVAREEIATPPEAGWRVTWLGHASFLLQARVSRCWSIRVFKPLRAAAVPEPAAEGAAAVRDRRLAEIDADLADARALRSSGFADAATDREGDEEVIAEGHANWLRRKGFTDVSELAWHAGAEIFPGIRVTATPAQHFTARTLLDRNRGHWAAGWSRARAASSGTRRQRLLRGVFGNRRALRADRFRDDPVGCLPPRRTCGRCI